ncbi:hypothetical protein GGS23DRAFT_558795 [Durotheca rogersii]|uniref:uncharacterized protein n=1 Tax=Durotheca rogersii TaxID=419775 RepID=UPI002220949B|nr:uncharacterized protein GGS23DRAFT_558795 [Durotheca rogersii]KAI5865345.1 hypothetical protein GGS23DRAFT_558795 [Durotheca rogersii]
MHKMVASIRVPPSYAGVQNPPETTIEICNDTGSNIQSVHRGDLQAIGADPANPQFTIPTNRVDVKLAQGQSTTSMLLRIQMRLLAVQGAQLAPLTEWFQVDAVLDDTGGLRLSGHEMRHYLYFATAKGNSELYVGQTKTALQKRLPAV